MRDVMDKLSDFRAAGTWFKSSCDLTPICFSLPNIKWVPKEDQALFLLVKLNSERTGMDSTFICWSVGARLPHLGLQDI